MHRELRNFTFYLIMGFLNQYLLLFLWGAAAGPASFGPYFALFGSILVMVLSCNLGLFSTKWAAIISFCGVILMFVLPFEIAMGGKGSLSEIIVVSVIPSFVALFSCWSLFKRINRAVVQGVPELGTRKKIILSIIPIVIQMFVFNGLSMFRLLLKNEM